LFLADYYHEKVGIIAEVDTLKDEDSTKVIAILVIIFTFIAGLVWILNARLILFHFYLYKNNLTTYTFTLDVLEKKKNRIKRNSISPETFMNKTTDPSLNTLTGLTCESKILKRVSDQHHPQIVVSSPKNHRIEVLITNTSYSTAEENTPKKSEERRSSFSLFSESAKKTDKTEQKQRKTPEKTRFFKEMIESKKDDCVNIGNQFVSGSVFKLSPLSSQDLRFDQSESNITMNHLKLQQIQRPDLSLPEENRDPGSDDIKELRLAQILQNYSPTVDEILEEDNDNDNDDDDSQKSNIDNSNSHQEIIDGNGT